MATRSQSRHTPRPRRQPARRILVVTEGTRTEPQYVERLNAFLRSHRTTTVVKTVAVGKDPLKVVEKCIEVRDEAKKDGKDYDASVCLVDVDTHSALPDAALLAARKSILLLVSNLKFEVWLRWHAEDRRGTLTSSQLDELVSKLGLVKDKKLSASFPFHEVHTACKIARSVDSDLRASRVGPDPSSAMPILIDLMLGAQS